MVQERHGFFVEGKMPDQKSVEYHSTAPNIHAGAFVSSLSNDFGSGVVGASAGCFEHPAIFHQVGESKICDFDEPVGVDE